MALSILIEDYILNKRYFLWVSEQEEGEVNNFWCNKDNRLPKILRQAGITSARDMIDIEGDTWRKIVAGSLIRFSYHNDTDTSQLTKTLKYTCAAMVKSIEYKTGVNVDHLKISRISDSSYSFDITGGASLTLQDDGSIKEYLKSTPKFSIVVDNTSKDE